MNKEKVFYPLSAFLVRCTFSCKKKELKLGFENPSEQEKLNSLVKNIVIDLVYLIIV